jgi:predicted dienelactone hydrolase
VRPFEIALVVTLLVRIAALASARGVGLAGHGPSRRAVPLLIVAALAAHLALEGPRWNLAGVYALAALVVLEGVRGGSRRGRAPGPVRRAGRTVLGLAGLLVVVAPAALLPVPELPAPTGPFPVGTDAIEYRLAQAQGGARVRARIWYPATEAARAAPAAPWLEQLDAMLPALAESAGLPGWTLSHLAHTRVHAVWGAALGGDGPLGVVTFDHGRGGFAAQNTFLAEELASHGWLVVAPEHPGGALLTVFQDGTRVPFDPAAFGEGLEGEPYREAIRALGRRWIAETAAALDALASGAGPSGLAQRLDLERLVTSGHSTGGGTAFGLCGREPGCRATVGLDPWLLPTPPALLAPAPEGGLPVRVAGLFSDPALGFFEPTNLDAFGALAAATDARGGRASRTIYLGAGHNDFADVGLLSPVADRLGLDVGPTPPRDVLPRIRAEVLGVLDQADEARARLR